MIGEKYKETNKKSKGEVIPRNRLNTKYGEGGISQCFETHPILVIRKLAMCRYYKKVLSFKPLVTSTTKTYPPTEQSVGRFLLAGHFHNENSEPIPPYNPLHQIAECNASIVSYNMGRTTYQFQYGEQISEGYPDIM